MSEPQKTSPADETSPEPTPSPAPSGAHPYGDSSFRDRMHEIIFEADTPAGKLFDLLLIISILASVVIVILDSVDSIHDNHGEMLKVLEWTFTILFTGEYVCRLLSVRRPLGYARSFFGLVDLLAIIPTYVSMVFPGAETLLVVRVLRILRLFRILKLVRYVQEARTLMRALRASVAKITVFLFAVLTVVVIMGSIMHLVEGPEHGFPDIPTGMYWAIVTLTTVGYGDITPETPLGKAIAMAIMILGYGMLAVPTGIVSVELSHAERNSLNTKACRECGFGRNDDDAVFCKRCGGAL